MENDVSDDSFENDVIKKSGSIPVMVDFWAPWCGPCMMLKPVLEKLAGEFDGKVVLAKVNVDANKKYATEFGVMSIPAVKLFKNGKVVDEFNGAQPEDMIRTWLNKML